jgi:hypothetical protein
VVFLVGAVGDEGVDGSGDVAELGGDVGAAEIEAVGEACALVDADGGGAGACRLADQARDAGAAADLAEADAVGAEQRPVLADGAADSLAGGLMTGA